jgi:hypothetical protein
MNEQPQPGKKPEAETASPPPAKKRKSWLPMLVLLGVYLAGFGPMWLKSSRLNRQLFGAERELRLNLIQLTFANAALEARRGKYEPARQNMANFFNLITSEQDRGVGSALPTGASEALKPLLAQRDDLITLLARGDAASAERLATAYADFRQALGHSFP